MRWEVKVAKVLCSSGNVAKVLQGLQRQVIFFLLLNLILHLNLCYFLVTLYNKVNRSTRFNMNK